MARLRNSDWPGAAFLWTALLLVFLPTGPPAHAASHQRPFWTEQAMFRFGEHLFFVGRASCARSEEDGRDQSFHRGLRELLNYTQASSAMGLTIETQMMFHERDSAGCPAGTVTVWRLLRVGADKVATLAKAAAYRPGHERPVASAPPRMLGPPMGMSREEVLQRFGRPRSISMRNGGSESIWHFPRFGLLIRFDADDVVIGWKLDRHEQPEKTAAPVAGESRSTVDLTSRLRDLEETPDGLLNIVYNQAHFPFPSSPAEELALPPSVNNLPRGTEAKSAPKSRTPGRQAQVLEKPLSEPSPFEVLPAGGEAFSTLYDSQNRIIPYSIVKVGLQIAN